MTGSALGVGDGVGVGPVAATIAASAATAITSTRGAAHTPPPKPDRGRGTTGRGVSVHGMNHYQFINLSLLGRSSGLTIIRSVDCPRAIRRTYSQGRCTNPVPGVRTFVTKLNRTIVQDQAKIDAILNAHHITYFKPS
jgi:hypothetical protein